MTHIPPFQTFLDLGEDIKTSWGEASVETKSSNNTDTQTFIKPPPERLGQKTLQELSDMGNIDLQKAIKILQSKGLNHIDSNTKINLQLQGESWLENYIKAKSYNEIKETIYKIEGI